MSDIYGKCQNPTCRSSCNKFAMIILAPGLVAPVKCVNCGCFQYQHEWLATWDAGANSLRYFEHNKNKDSSSSTISTTGSSHHQTPSTGAVNRELHNEVYPPYLPPFKSPTAAAVTPSTQRLGGGNSLAKQKLLKQQENFSSSKRQKLIPKDKLTMFLLPAHQETAPTLSTARLALNTAGQFFEEFPYENSYGVFVSQLEFEDFIRKSKLKNQFMEADWEYTFYQQHKAKRMVEADSLTSELFPDAQMWKALADDCNSRGMVVICKPGGPLFNQRKVS